MAAVDRKQEIKMASLIGVLVPAVLLCALANHGAEGQNCTLPIDLRGVWVDSVKGALTFDNNSIKGYDIHTFGEFTLTCYIENGTTYIMESSSFMFFSLNFSGYFCWTFTKVTDDLYYFYEHTAALKDAGYEKVKMYLTFSTRVYNDMCSNPDPGLGTYRILYRNNTLSSATSATTCPTAMQNYYTYNMTVGGVTSCNSGSTLDVCTKTSTFTFNGSNCTTTLGYTAGVSVSCLVQIQSGAMIYLTLLNDDVTVDDITTYRLTCMIVDTSASPYLVTQYPTQCPDDMNATYVASPGASLAMTITGSCPTTTTDLLWIIGVVLGLVLLMAMLCACFLYRKRQREKERQKELERQRALDDARYDDDSLSTRGDFPPNVTIAIMQGRSRGKKDLPEDKPGFRTSGDVTPSGILPSYDAPHRRFSKRRRVWVIGDDGKVVKVWKEGKDGKESPDSGLEDEDEGGDKVDGKYVGKFGKRGVDKGHRDFLKQFGRQDIKDPEELKEKGDMHKASSKLMAKVKRMAGFRAFSRASTRARSHRSKGGKSQDRDRDGSAYRQSGTISEASYDSEVDSRVVLGEKEQNKLNELSEKQLKEGLKNSGDKGRDSPDSGTGRDSALSSHSSAYSNDNDERGGGDGGKRDRSRRSRRDKDGKGSSARKDGKGRHSGDSTGREGGGGGSQGDGKGGDNGKGGAGGSGGGVGGSGGDRSGGGGDGYGGAGGSGTGGGSTGGGSDGGSGGGDGSRSRSRGGRGGQGGEANDAVDGSGRGGDTAFRDGRGGTDTTAGSDGGRSEGRGVGGEATAWGVGSGGGGGGRGGSGGGGGGDINSSTETLNRNDSARPGGPGQHGGPSHHGSEPASRGRPRDSKRRTDNVRSQISSFASTRDDVTLPSMSSGFLGSDYDTSTPMDTAGGRSGDRGGKSGARMAIGGKESQEDLYYGAGHSNMIIVTPRDGEVQGEDRRPVGKGQGDQEGGAANNGHSKRGGRSKQNLDDSVESAIDLNDPFTAQAPAVVLESGRPPTGHQQRRHGWQAGDRSRSRSPPKPTEDERTKSQVARSYSDRLTDSRSVHWQGSQAEVSVPGTADAAGRRSVRWKEDGGSQGNTLMVPVTPGMAVRRHPDSDGAASSLSRQSRPYSSMSRLARIHRKKKAVAPIDDQDYEQDPRARLQRPPDMDDLAWKRLLEELYPDKKYLDYAKATSSEETNERFLNIKAGEGLHYLYDRAKFWKAQEPLVRPGTNMSVRSIDSRAPSTVPPRGL